MASTSTMQFNVRIDPNIKAEGDRVFAAIGLTPTTAVRTLYELAVRNKNNPKVVMDSLGIDAAESAENDRISTMQHLVDKGRQIIPNFLKEYGIEEITLFSDDANERAQQYKEMAHAAMYEKYCQE